MAFLKVERMTTTTKNKNITMKPTKKEHNGALYLALLILVTLIMLLTGCKTKQSGSNSYLNVKDSTNISSTQITALDSLKINDTTTVKIEGEKVITSVSSGRTTEITLDSSSLTTLTSILDGSAFLPVKSIKITDTNRSDLSTSNVKVDKNTTKDITSVQSGSFQATDTTNVKDSTKTKSNFTKESKATGGFGWGVTVTIFILLILVIGFLYLKYK